MKLKLLATSLFFAFGLKSQIFQITDQKVFGGALEESSTSGVLNNNKLILGGSSNSDVSGDKTIPSYGLSDYWVISINESYLFNWQNGFGGNQNDQLVKVINTIDGGYILSGFSESPVSGNKTAVAKGENDFWLVKLDEFGDELWQKSYGGTGDDLLTDLVELPNGNMVLVGSSTSPISGDKTESNIGVRDFWVIRTNSSGDIISDKTIGGSEEDSPESVFVDEYESVYISGTSNSPISGHKSENSYGSSDSWVVKIDADNNLVWDRTLGGSGAEINAGLINDGSFLFICNSSMSGASGTKTEASRGIYDFWVTKLDTNGNIINDKTIGGDGVDLLTDSYLNSNGDILLSGYSNSGISGEVVESSQNGSNDFWVVEIDTNDLSLGEQLMIGGDDTEFSPYIVEKNNNLMYLIGGSNSGVSGDKTEPSKGGSDFWLLELTTDLSVSSHDIDKILSIYPNPTSNTFKISNLSSEESYRIIIYDNMGKVVLQPTISATNNSVEVNSLSSGMYTVQLLAGDKRYVSKLVVE